MGLTELAGGSLYLGQITIAPSGQMIGHRRKLKPTHAERTIWGEGDGSDLFTLETEIGQIGSLNCWEHLQPLTRFAMNCFNEQIHVSAWPAFCLYTGTLHSFSAEANLAVSRSYALETQTFVIRVGGLCDQETFELLAGDDEKRQLLRVGGGASEIIDPAGNYARADVTQLLLNRRPRHPVIFLDTEPPETLAGEVPNDSGIVDGDAELDTND